MINHLIKYKTVLFFDEFSLNFRAFFFIILVFDMSEASGVDYGKVPLVALRSKSRKILSLGLDCSKIIPSPSGYPRDWRGLADIANVPLTPCGKSDPTVNVIGQWERGNSNFKQLTEALKEIDRWDVLDDLTEFLDSDANEYFNSMNEPNQLGCNQDQVLDADFTLTDDDVRRKEIGLGPQIYDAFLLYADEDKEFAMEIVKKLENEYNSKLCLKERDLLGGISIEHEAIMRLISQRCNRVIIVLSESFLNSPANKFFVAFAQALAITQESRKIIPVTYKNVKLEFPVQLQHYFILNYCRANNFGNFWDKLSQSVKLPSSQKTRLSIEAPCAKAIEWKQNEPKFESLPVKDWDCNKNVKQNGEAAKYSVEEVENSSNDCTETKSHEISKTKNTASAFVKKTKKLFKKKKKIPVPS